MATSEMDYMNIGGGKVYWKTIATSSTNQTYAQCLTELKTTWDTLTDEEKGKTRIVRDNSILNVLSISSGIFGMEYVASNNQKPTIIQFNILTSVRYSGVIDGSAFTDSGSSNNAQALQLQLLTYERI